MPRDQHARFWRKVQGCIHGPRCAVCCHEWQGGRNRRGYGRTRFVLFGGEETYAHRVAYALTWHRLPGPLDVCHTCDNPPCCNPFHLWLGTHAENHADSTNKGRARGAHHPKAFKLTPTKVRAIRKAWRQGTKQRAIAQRFDVSQPLVSAILRGTIWTHV